MPGIIWHVGSPRRDERTKPVLVIGRTIGGQFDALADDRAVSNWCHSTKVTSKDSELSSLPAAVEQVANKTGF